MNWYSFFVVTGKEECVAEWLHIYFPEWKITAVIPKRRLLERKRGKTKLTLRKMFPGYLLVYMEMNPQIYSTLKKIPYLIRILNSGEYYTEIPPEEITCIRKLLNEDDVLDFSKINFVNSRVIVKSGPLKGMEELIRTVDKRKQRAKITLQFMGLSKEIDVGIEMVD